MFNDENTEYWIEYVFIVTIDEGIDIDVSFKFNQYEGNIINRVYVCGIHLDKVYIFDQHKLVDPN